MCHRRQHWPKALSIVACVLMNFSTAITTDNSTSSATISSSTIFANSSTSTRSSSTSITSSSSSSSSANPQVLYSYASVTPTSTLNLSSSNANLTTPTPTESLKAGMCLVILPSVPRSDAAQYSLIQAENQSCPWSEIISV